MARFFVTIFRPLALFGSGSSVCFASRTPRFSSLMKRIMAYSTYESGAPNSMDFRLYFRDNNGQAISPFHDIPLFANAEKTICNMVVEIPRWTNAKMEISTKEALNPIKQDCKKGKLRFVHNCFPYHGYIWNYGALPQTWEDPSHTDENTHCSGDNDPIDACEIGTMTNQQTLSFDATVGNNTAMAALEIMYKHQDAGDMSHKQIATRGEVKQVKILGTVAMIDEGETDWKIFCIDVNDPLAKDMNDVDDIEKHMPGLLQATVDWFKIYKIPAGSAENKFAFNDEAKDKEFAMKIVNETHEHWRKLVLKEIENEAGLACKNVTVDKSPYKMSAEEATGIINHAAPPVEPQPIDPSLKVDRWHYIKRPKL